MLSHSARVEAIRLRIFNHYVGSVTVPRVPRKSTTDWGDDDYEVYSPSQVEGVLEYCGIEVVSDTHTHLLAYCPFHGNTDSPAMAVDKIKGLWTCFNPSCQNAGKLIDL